MDFKDMIKEAVKYSKYEKIEAGIYDFIVDYVELSTTEKSKRTCIFYYGRIKNKFGELQETKLVDAVDNANNIKFGVARLIKFIKYFKVATEPEIENASDLNELINLANKAKDKNIKIEFIKRLVGGVVIKEKVFIFE